MEKKEYILDEDLPNVRNGNQISQILRGVPQEIVLGLLLFIIALLDKPMVTQTSTVTISMIQIHHG